MASVFLAWDNKLKVWRAIKVLLPSVMTKKKVRKRFENEAHAMARLEHPNIIRVYDVGAENNVPFMVMELAEGGCVIDWLSRFGAMPPRLAVDVSVQICKGIRAAHESGIIHRDIKPHNVLVNRKGQCKVTDFGIAQVMHLDDLTKTGSVMGTWGYMAPEQRTDAKNIDERADVFSIGATLYTLLTHKTPTELYVADEDDDIFDGIPPELLEVILSACQYKPAARYADVHALGLAIYQAGTSQKKVPPSTPSLILSSDPLPESIESAEFSPTILEELNQAIGKDGSEPEEDPETPDTPPPREPASAKSEATVPDPAPAPAQPSPPPAVEPSNKVLPYYMSSARDPVPSSRNRGSSDVPSYINPEELHRNDPSQRVRATAKAPPTQPPEPPKPVSNTVIPLLAVGLVLILAAAGVVAFGMQSVDGAASRAEEHATMLLIQTKQPGALVDALVAAGADRSPLDAAYARFADASGPERAFAASQFVQLLRGAAASAPTANPAALKEIGEMAKTSESYLAAREEWAAAAAEFPGSLAVGIGLTRGP